MFTYVYHSQSWLVYDIVLYIIWLFNSSPWTIPHKWRFLAGKIIYFYGPWLPMAMLNNQRVTSFGLKSLKSFGISHHSRTSPDQRLPCPNLPHFTGGVALSRLSTARTAPWNAWIFNIDIYLKQRVCHWFIVNIASLLALSSVCLFLVSASNYTSI